MFYLIMLQDAVVANKWTFLIACVPIVTFILKEWRDSKRDKKVVAIQDELDTHNQKVDDNTRITRDVQATTKRTEVAVNGVQAKAEAYIKALELELMRKNGAVEAQRG